jgi:Uma2 family endonuclease
MPATKVQLGADQWVSIPATWENYEGLLRTRGEKGQPKYIFLDGSLTVVSPSQPHEWLSFRLVGLIHEILVKLSIPCHVSGRVTLHKAADSLEGTEPDASYYLTNRERVAGKRKLVMGQDPPPDLVLEVVISHPEHDALEAYRRFGVREVWVCKESGLEFLVLGEDGHYHASPVSACLPFLQAEEMSFWLFRDDLADDTRLWQLFGEWVTDTLLPRYRPDADA